MKVINKTKTAYFLTSENPVDFTTIPINSSAVLISEMATNITPPQTSDAGMNRLSVDNESVHTRDLNDSLCPNHSFTIQSQPTKFQKHECEHLHIITYMSVMY